MRDEAAPRSADLVVRGGTVVTAHGRREADVVISGGRIGAVLPPGAETDAGRALDATGCFVLPGAVDAHVHLDGPAPPEAPGFVDDLRTGTRAAVHGGVTTVGQMSFSDGETFEEAVGRDRRRAAREAIVDYVLHPGIYHVTPAALEEIPRLAAAGAGTIKLATLALDDGGADLFGDAVAAAARGGLLTMVHCEDGALIAHATHALQSSGRGGMQHYPDSRPALSESAAVERTLAFAEAAHAPVYLVHVSSRRALDVARAARARGQEVFVETRPIYLYLTRTAHEAVDGARFVGMPPLREETDVDALWRGIADGVVDTVATDHAPWMLRDKLDPDLDLVTSRKGVAELDTFLPLLYDRGVRTGRITLERLVAVSAENPARLLGLYPAKGTIEVGADADVVVLDPRLRRTVRAAELESASDYSVYEGWEVTGWPRYVVARGDVLLDAAGGDGMITGAPGRGRFLPAGPRHPPV